MKREYLDKNKSKQIPLDKFYNQYEKSKSDPKLLPNPAENKAINAKIT